MAELQTFKELVGDNEWMGLGIAGNQADHLNQAGETNDFKNVDALENAPKGMFPWFIPEADSFLAIDPLSSSTISLRGEDRVQAEPEIALILKFHYGEERFLDGIEVRGFTVLNDLSRRISAPKISIKKNWGTASQGVGQGIIPIDDFLSPDGAIGKFRLACYLVRDGELISYGEDTAVSDYCYFNETLVDWMVTQINTQEDFGPLENLRELIGVRRPAMALVGIGATRYSEFGQGEERFLRTEDQVIVTAYDGTVHTGADVETRLRGGRREDSSMLVLSQLVE